MLVEAMIQPSMTEPKAPICATQKCKRPLTRLGPPRDCWRCLVCNPIVEAKPTETRKRRDIDKQLSEERVIEIIKEQIGSAQVISFDEERVREIVQDELQDWFIQKPPMTRGEIAETIPTPSMPPEQTWRQQAKELDISLMKEPAGTGMRKKVDVLADIAAIREKSTKALAEGMADKERKIFQEATSPEGDTNDSPVTAEKGA